MSGYYYSARVGCTWFSADIADVADIEHASVYAYVPDCLPDCLQSASAASVREFDFQLPVTHHSDVRVFGPESASHLSGTYE